MLTNSSKRFLALILILTLSLSFGAGHALDETIGSPFNVSAEKLSNGIRLSWSAPSGDVTAYRINRRRPELGEDKLTRIVDNTGNAETSYVDTDVRIEDEVYVYRVTALRGEARGKLSRPLWVEVGPGDFGTAVEPSSTPVPPPSNTPVPPPPDTAVPPTSKSQEQTPSIQEQKRQRQPAIRAAPRYPDGNTGRAAADTGHSAVRAACGYGHTHLTHAAATRDDGDAYPNAASRSGRAGGDL